MRNIYDLLELSIDPRPQFTSLDEIKNLIESQKRVLDQKARGSQQAINKQKIAELNTWSEGLTMQTMDQAYEDAKKEVKKDLQDAIGFIAINNSIKKEKAEQIAKDHKVTVSFILKEIGVSLQEDEIKTLKIPVCKNKLNSQVKNRLLIVGKKNLYDFLNYHGSDSNLERITLKMPEDLQAIGRNLGDEFDANPDLEIKSAGTKLAQLCQEIFKDKETKEDYDYYINYYEPINAVLSKVNSLSDHGTLLPQTGEKLVKDINRIVRNVGESRAYLRGKCKDIEVIWTEMPDSTIANCFFCGEPIGVNDEVCGRCGKKQFIVCDKCGKKSKAGSEYCTSCGNNFGDVKKISAYCDAAKKEIELLNFNVAKYYISLVDAQGSQKEEVEKIKQDLNRTEELVGEQVARLETCKKNKEYYKAQKLLRDIKKMYPNYEDENLDSLINNVLSKAKILYDRANHAAKESECLELCDEIDQLCSDYPGVKDLKDKFPPEVPYDVIVKIDNTRKINDILWNYAGISAGVSFEVVRKEYAKPVDRSDGQSIGVFSAHSCSDKNIEPGREYYYAVFACRGNRISKPGHAKHPVVNVFNVENVAAHPDNGVVKLQWKNPGNGTVRVWRKENSVPTGEMDGIEIQNVSASGVWDNDVLNDHSYGYYICTEYRVGGKAVFSDGIKLAHIVPEIPPQAVTYLLSSINESDKQVFTLEWDDDIRDTIKFYGSPEPLEWEENSTIDRTLLESKATPLTVLSSEMGVGIVNIGNAEQLYITAVTIGKQSCLIGANTFVSNKQIFKVTETRLVHGELHIFLDDWPKECNMLKVLFHNSMYPKAVNDKSAESIVYRKSMYSQTKSIVIRNIAQRDYYVSIYGKLSGDKGYAPAVHVQFSNQSKITVSYEMIVKKGLMGRINNVMLSFTSSEEEFELPELLVIKNSGFLPPTISDGKQIKEVQSSKEKQKKYVIELGKDFRTRDYIKVFLKNSQDAAFIELNAISGLSI